MEPQDSANTPDSATPGQPARQTAPTLAPLEQRIILQMPSPWGRVGWKILCAVLVFSLLVNLYFLGTQQEAYSDPDDKINERFVSGDRMAKQKIAVIRVEGTILEGDGFVKQQIDRAAKDDDVKAVVLRVDSPGGTVTGSNYIYHYLKKLSAEKPVVVSMGGICASGGYYIAMAAGNREDVIFAEQSTWTGSIGVIIPHYNVSELLKRWDIKDDSVARGEDKQLGSPTRPLGTEAYRRDQEILRSLVDGSYEEFKKIVLEGRSKLRKSEEHQKIAFSGRVVSATQALELGLIDKIGFIEDAVSRASDLAGFTSNDDVRVVKYTTHQPGLIEVLGGSEASVHTPGWAADLRSIMRLSTPRPYYLPNWLPGVLVD